MPSSKQSKKFSIDDGDIFEIEDWLADKPKDWQKNINRLLKKAVDKKDHKAYGRIKLLMEIYDRWQRLV